MGRFYMFGILEEREIPNVKLVGYRSFVCILKRHRLLTLDAERFTLYARNLLLFPFAFLRAFVPFLYLLLPIPSSLLPPPCLCPFSVFTIAYSLFPLALICAF